MAAAKLYVALWSVNTTDQAKGSWLRLPTREKLSALNLATSAFFRFRLAQKNIPSSWEQDRIRAIFVAPEYFLARPRDEEYGDRDYVDELTEKGFVRFIPGPINTLLVPGSVGVRKAVTAARIAKIQEKLSIDVSKKKHIVRNTAYGFIHSKKVLKCSKQGAATDGFKESDPDIFVPGWSTNKAQLTVNDGTDDGRKLRFGIEICADASDERSGEKGYVDSKDSESVDVKILVSAALDSTKVYAGNYTKCLVHASSEPSYSGIAVKGSNACERLQRQTFMGYQLDFYLLTIAA